MSDRKQFDTQATTTYLVRLSGDAKVFKRKDGKGEDVLLPFADNSGAGGETMWIDAQVADFQAERAKKYLKGDEVQVTGKVHYIRKDDGSLRGRIYRATVASFVKLSDRGETAPAPEAPADGVPAFA